MKVSTRKQHISKFVACLSFRERSNCFYHINSSLAQIDSNMGSESLKMENWFVQNLVIMWVCNTQKCLAAKTFGNLWKGNTNHKITLIKIHYTVGRTNSWLFFQISVLMGFIFMGTVLYSVPIWTGSDNCARLQPEVNMIGLDLLDGHAGNS